MCLLAWLLVVSTANTVSFGPFLLITQMSEFENSLLIPLFLVKSVRSFTRDVGIGCRKRAVWLDCRDLDPSRGFVLRQSHDDI